MKTALALGTFDGLHKGHREVLRLPAGMKKTAVIFPLPPKPSGGSVSVRMTAFSKGAKVTELTTPNFRLSART